MRFETFHKFRASASIREFCQLVLLGIYFQWQRGNAWWPSSSVPFTALCTPETRTPAGILQREHTGCDGVKSTACAQCGHSTSLPSDGPNSPTWPALCPCCTVYFANSFAKCTPTILQRQFLERLPYYFLFNIFQIFHVVEIHSESNITRFSTERLNIWMSIHPQHRRHECCAIPSAPPLPASRYQIRVLYPGVDQKVLTARTVVSSKTKNCSQAWCKAQEKTMNRRKKTHHIQVPRTMLHNIHQLAQLQVLVRTVCHVHETS